jgi:flagellar protein FlbT
MALKISLKPGERMIVGGAVIANGNRHSCDLIIQNNVAVLREKDILSEKDTHSPCTRIYFTVQLMYIDPENMPVHTETYWKLVGELIDAVPSVTGIIDQISEQIFFGRYYQALKLADKLIIYEEEVLKHAR